MSTKMILLVAGMGTRLQPLTKDLPKCLVPLRGRPLLEWQLESARAAGIEDFTLVGGYRADLLSRNGAELIVNPAYETTNMVESLWCARDRLANGALISYGDIVCSPAVIRSVLSAPHDVSVAVDRAWRPYWERRFDDPLLDAESLAMDADGRIRSIGQKVPTLDEINAQFIGLIGLSARGARSLLARYEAARGVSTGKGRRMFMTDLLHAAVLDGVPVHGVPVSGGWFEVDSLSDLRVAEELSREAGRSLEILR